MLENKSRTELSELGEFGLISHLTSDIKIHHESSIKGVGDDSAVIQYNNDKVTLVSTDLLVEGVHFDLAYMPLKHLGYKAVVVNLSDIYAMNGQPRQILVSMALSNRFSLDAVEEIYEGMKIACEKYKVDLVGGDTSTSQKGLVLSITAMGEADKDEVVYRKGAGENELLCVSGDLGGAYLGYQLLEREKRVFIENPSMQPDLEGYDYIVGRQLKPEARRDIIDLLKKLDVRPTSMIDISDGLASEIFHLCQHSDIGMKVYEEKIPVDHNSLDMAKEFSLDPTICALNGGEDYELLFTVKQADYDKIKGNPEITVIGYTTSKSEGINLITRNNNVYPLQAQGWDAFRKSDNQ